MEYIKLKLNYARNSLRYIIRTYNIRQLHLPYYLCDVIRHCIIKENCQLIFYHIDDNFMPVKIFKSDDFILYPNYFGICDKHVKLLSEKYPNLIVDNAHSFYSKPTGLACFNSERKFHSDGYGSNLWIQKKGPQLEYESISLKSQTERYESNICNTEPKFIHNIELQNYNSERLKIFKRLHEKYQSNNLLNIDIESCSCPFCYPFLAKTSGGADDLATNLVKQGLTIYRYWNLLPKSYNEYKFYRKLVPIPLTNVISNNIQQDS